MTKHNNVIPNQHFKKKWQFYVKTWFNQPARKVRRRNGEACTADGCAKLVGCCCLVVGTPAQAHWRSK